VAERRAGKFYPICNGVRRGVDLDIEGVAELVRWSGAYSELEARRRLADVAQQWRELFEHVR
jgi:DNA gyrase inhibitor GyrI